jgi:hypothetical protein
MVYQKMVDEGHLVGYQQSLSTFRLYRSALERELAGAGE